MYFVSKNKLFFQYTNNSITKLIKSHRSMQYELVYFLFARKLKMAPKKNEIKKLESEAIAIKFLCRIKRITLKRFVY